MCGCHFNMSMLRRFVTIGTSDIVQKFKRLSTLAHKHCTTCPRAHAPTIEVFKRLDEMKEHERQRVAVDDVQVLLNARWPARPGPALGLRLWPPVHDISRQICHCHFCTLQATAGLALAASCQVELSISLHANASCGDAGGPAQRCMIAQGHTKCGNVILFAVPLPYGRTQLICRSVAPFL